MKPWRWTLAAILAALGLPVAEAAEFRDLSLPQLLVQSVQPRDLGPLEVTAWVDDPDGVYQAGQHLTLSVVANRDAYFSVIAVGPTGDVTELLAVTEPAGSPVRAGQILTIPSGPDGGRIVISPPFGVELIRVIASTVARPILGPDQLPSGSAFGSGAGMAARQLQLLLDDQDVEVGFADLYIRSVRAIPAATGSGAVAPLPPLLALDRDTYVLGQTLQIAVTSLDGCHLWVVNVSPDQSARLLFPSAFDRDNKLATGETAIISGSPGGGEIIASGPPGREAIHAFCTVAATPPWDGELDLPEDLSLRDAQSLWAARLIQLGSVAVPESGDGYSRSGRVVSVVPR